MCVCVCACTRLCVFSVLVHQHLRPLIMTVMICQQMTYAPKKTFSFQRQLLSTTILPPSFRLLLSRLKHILLSPHSNSLYLSINIFHGFPIILILSVSPPVWPRPVIGGGATEGLSLFDLGCPALPPPALGPTGGLWRHLGPLGGYYKAPVWPSPLRQRG